MIKFNEFDIEEVPEGYIPDKEFVDFLRIHNAYHTYISNIKYDAENGNNIQGFFRETPKACYISNAFNWSQTSQGFKYWSNISKLWITYYI